ncbi:PAS/PAC sensor hybrid histidine kinase [Tolypothrix sp. NIES-4075]|uniref:PAS domain S-box protein n=1 Tax=Tolypothrix sp. NIES-4075 TaxID=2005459 RepID=UPI000B5CA611|nr:PAS domain S-box protein [Tolypothrix sp. NIES-4075]GAX43027.1 PAS/PAC sensor hybrid histidine kinase [Tolypothrix sp. NIES-4075]
MFNQLDEYNSQLFELCPVGLVLCRTDGTLININPAYAAILGRTVPETLNLNYWQITPENYAADQATLENLEQTGRYSPYEMELIHKDGHLVPVRISGLMIEKDGEQLIWSSVEDISDFRCAQQERQHTEQILKQSEARYRSLVTANTQIVWVSTPEGICFELTDWIAYTGQSLAEAENGGWIDAVHPDDRAYTKEVWGAAVANLSMYQIEYRIRGNDGNYRYFWVWGAPVIEEDGSVREWIGTCTDIHDRKLAEAEKQYLEQRYRSLVTASSQMVWTASPEGMVNSEIVGWEAYTGQSAAEMMGWGWLDVMHPDDRAESAEVWSAAVANRTIYQLEYRIRAKDGTYRYFFGNAAPVLEADGSIREWIGTCTDIHDRKLAEQTLQQSEERFRSLVTASSQIVWVTTPEGLGVSSEMSTWLAYTGQSADEIQDLGWLDPIYPDDRTCVALAWSAAVANHSLFQTEYRLRGKDGSYRHFSICGTPVLEEDGSVREWIGTCTDIHERKLAEAENQRLKERYRSLVTATSQIVWGATPEGLGISSEMLTWIAYTGQSEAEVEGWGWIDPIHPDDRAGSTQAWNAAVANRGIYQTEYRLRGKDGTYRYFSVCGAPVLEEDGSIREWIGTCTDIDDRKLAEAENQRLLDMLNHSSDAIIVRDMSDKISHWNQGAERLYGWMREEVKDQCIQAFIKKTFLKPKEEIVAELLEQGNWEGEVEHLTHEGKLITVQSRWTLQRDISGQPCAVLEINTDITARKQAEIALRQLNQELEARVVERTSALQNTLAEAQGLNAILDNLADGLLVADTTGQITHFNPAFLAMYGLTATALNGHYRELPISGLADLVDRTQSHPKEVFAAEVALTKERIGQAVATAIFKKTADSEPDACFGSALLIRDVTAEKEIDQMKTDFISTVSHELRTPLTSVLGFASIIKEKLETDVFPIISTEDRKLQKTIKRVGDNLNIIVSEAERLTSLINDVLDIAKMEAGKVEWQMQPIDPSELVDWATNSTAGLFETNGLHLIGEIEPGLPQIVGDRNRLLQVLINLISNAVKFTESGCVICRVKQGNDGVCISVIDTGIGITPEDQPKVFEKFRQVGDTLTDKPKGTGLGLPICKQIIDHHGGRIWVESEPGKGSTFSFTIPTYTSAHKTSSSLNLDTLVKQLKEHVITTNAVLNENRKTILVVDDDLNIRELLRQQLENEGYNVREAKDGVDAIHQIKTARPDLILLDVMMPQINGFDVAAVLKNDPQTADIPIIILSIIENKERGYHIGIDRYLTKPINTEKLLNEIGSLLSQGTSSKKVLVVDKNASTLKTISDVLQTQGYSVIEASDAQECVHKALSTKPDMIIIDSIFSQEADLVKALRFEKQLENVFFIMLSDR